MIAVFAFAVFFGTKTVQAADVPYTTPYVGLVTAKSGTPIYQEAGNTASAYTYVKADYGWVVDVTAVNGNYYKITFYYGNASNKLNGYVPINTLALSKLPSKEKFESLKGYIGTVQYNNVDIRSTSNYRNVIKIVNKGTKLTIVGRSDSWYKVKLNSTTYGYVYRGLLQAQNIFRGYISFTYPKNPKQGVKYQIKIVDKSPVAFKKSVTWSSSNKKIVKVTSSGKFTIKKAGTATISCKIKVGSLSKTYKFKISSSSSWKFYE